MTKQHLDDLFAQGLINKKTNTTRIIIAVLLACAGIGLCVSAGSLGAASDTVQIGVYVIAAIAIIACIWVLCLGTTAYTNATTGEAYKKKAYYIKSAEINNVVNALRQIGVKNDIKNSGSGAFRVVTMTTKSNLIMAVYQYVPHEYVNASEIITINNANYSDVISTLQSFNTK